MTKFTPVLGVVLTSVSLFHGDLNAQSFVEGTIQGQNGWAKKTDITEAVIGSDAHSGGQAWHLAHRGSTSYGVQVTSSVFGGVGESGAMGSPAANNASLEFWTRTADTAWSANTTFSISLGALASKRNSYFGMTASSGGIFARADDYSTDILSTEPLEWGTWYRVVVNASFVDGLDNDVVSYELFDAGGDSLWQVSMGSWEQGYFNGEYEPGVPGNIMTSNLLVFNGSATGNGFIFDDISLRTWNSADPDTTLSSYQTGFEAVPEPSTPAFFMTGGILWMAVFFLNPNRRKSGNVKSKEDSTV